MLKRELVNDGKGRCYRLGPVELILNGSVYGFSLAFGKALVILVKEQD